VKFHPALFLLLGFPGAGKTTAAEVIADLTGATHLSSDKARMDLFGKPSFSKAEHDELYRSLDKQTEELLAQGKSVIYDANLNRYKHRKEKYRICEHTGAKPILIWVQTPKDIARGRAVHTERLHLVPPSESPRQMFDRIAEIIEEPDEQEPYIALDGTKINPQAVSIALDL